MRAFPLLLTTSAAVIAAGCSASSTPTESLPPVYGGGGALLTVVFPSHTADTLHVFVTDTATIAQAERFVSTGLGPRMLSGRIARGPGSDPRYPFHFITETVRLVDAAMELCDGAPMHTDAAVTEFFLNATGNANSDSAPWCPWESRPIAVTRLLGADRSP